VSNEKNEQFVVWNKNYAHMGVTPRELYMRQKNLCWLVVEGSEIHCTDGKEKATTNRMLNPTFECIKCITSFTKRVMKDGH
jgi:hypothetical protein